MDRVIVPPTGNCIVDRGDKWRVHTGAQVSDKRPRAQEEGCGMRFWRTGPSEDGETGSADKVRFRLLPESFLVKKKRKEKKKDSANLIHESKIRPRSPELYILYRPTTR